MYTRAMNQTIFEPIADERRAAFFEEKLKEGAAHIYYSVSAESVIYYATFDGEVGSFEVDIGGNYKLLGGNKPFCVALGRFIRRKDEQEGEEVLKNRYGGDYERMDHFLKLGPEKAKKEIEVLTKLDDMAEEFGKESPATNNVAPKLLFYVESETPSGFSVSLHIGFNKLYLNRQPIRFIRDYYRGKPVIVQKEKVMIPLGSFDEPTEKGLQLLYNVGTSEYYYNDNSPVPFALSDFIRFCRIMAGKDIELNRSIHHINEPIQIEVAIDDDGKMTANPEIEAEKCERAGQSLLQITDNEVFVYDFASSKALDIFFFYRSIGDLPTDTISDEVARKLLPAIEESEIHVSEEFSKRHPVYRPKIEYYVALEEESRLTFDTVYRFGPNVVDEDEFIASSPACRAKQEGFVGEIDKLKLPQKGVMEGDANIIAFLTSLKTGLKDLAKYATIYVSEDLQAKKVAPPPPIDIHSSSGQDWFEVELYSSGYTEEELRTIFLNYRKKKKFVKLRGDYILLDGEDDSLRAISEAFEPEQLGIQLPLYQALKLPSLGHGEDAMVKELIRRVESYEDMTDYVLPTPIREAARNYQLQGIKFLLNLYRNELSGVLSDDMGLGKTLQTFGLFANIKEEMPILVVCPKSLIYNWMAERKKWYPEIEAHVLVGSPKERKELYLRMKEARKSVYFVSYDTLRNDKDSLNGVEFSAIILDEGQYISNAHALKTKAVKSLKSKSRFVLTGTPVQNSLMDIWSIFDFLLPGYFPPLTKFRELYGGLEFASEESRARLLSKIKPFLLGRKKKDVLTELPDKENIEITLDMTSEQRVVYESYLTKARDVLEEKKRMKVLGMMTNLREICITPSLFLEGEYPSTKIEYLCDSIRDLKLSGRKAIVFSSFVTALNLIEKELDKVGISHASITGKTPAKERVTLADKFNSDKDSFDVMLVSLKAGGTGLNLVGADTVFHLDPWWNLAAERQAEDRAHRIGQKNKVTVFKLVVRDSIEEKVIALQKMKGELIDLTDEASLEGSLSEEDIRFLLS